MSLGRVVGHGVFNQGWDEGSTYGKPMRGGGNGSSLGVQVQVRDWIWVYRFRQSQTYMLVQGLSSGSRARVWVMITGRAVRAVCAFDQTLQFGVVPSRG